jgi:hypothetical protein
MRALTAVQTAMRTGGHFVLEVRDPARRAWEGWTRDASLRTVEPDGVGVQRFGHSVTGWPGDERRSTAAVCYRDVPTPA